jgi:uncharacterized membrane protein YiaA
MVALLISGIVLYLIGRALERRELKEREEFLAFFDTE